MPSNAPILDATEYFNCCCSSPTHTMRMVLDLDELSEPEVRYPTIYTEIMLDQFQPWYKRIWIGIGYMFSRTTPDHFGCWEIKYEDCDALINMIQRLKKYNKEI